MRAIVKVAYFDDLGLHKVGDVVEVKALKPFHKAIEEEKPEEVKPVTETVEVKPTKKKTTKKSTKKTVKKG